MASSAFTVAMVLTAYNNLRGPLEQARRQVGQLGQSVATVNSTPLCLKVDTKSIEKARTELDKLESSGTAQLASGAALAAPFVAATKAAGEFQDILTEIKINTYDSAVPVKKWEANVKSLGSQIQSLADKTRFNATEVGAGYLALLKGGVTSKDIRAGTGRATVYGAQVAGISPDAMAEYSVKIGNAYNIQGREMNNLMDFMTRVDSASTASVASLADGYKYASSSAAQLGQSYKDTGLALAVLNNAGLDGTTAGTNYADMLRRLTPTTKLSAAAMKELGLSTADVASIKRGQSRLGLAGKDLFHDQSGKLKPMVEVINILRQKTKGLRADVVQTAFTEMFGVEGARAALALIKKGKGSWEEINAAVSRSMNLNQRVAEQQKTFNANLEQAKGAWYNLLVTAGTPLLPELTKAMKAITSFIGWITNLGQTYPGATKAIMYFIGAIAGMNLALGGGKIAWVLIRRSILPVCQLFGWAGRGISGFIQTFRYFRQGAGFFRSLWGAIAFGRPWLIKIGLLISRFGTGFMTAIKFVARFGGVLLRTAAQALIAGARMALAWLIGLGPIGWIIMGVTALIALVVVAWKKNLFGFRDKVIALGQWFKNAWSKIKNWGSNLRKWGANLIKEFVQGIKDKISHLTDALKGAADKVKKFLGFSSPTEEGPGRTAHRWAPNLIQMYAAGIRRGRNDLAHALAYMTGPLALMSSPALSLAGAGRIPGSGSRRYNSLTGYEGAGGAVFQINIQRLAIESTGNPDYDAEKFVDRILPTLEKKMAQRAKYKNSRSGRRSS